LATGQKLVSLWSLHGPSAGFQSTAAVVLSGTLRVAGPDSGVYFLSLTDTLTAQGKSVANLGVQNVSVPQSKTGVLLLNPKTSDTVDATNARLQYIVGYGDAAAANEQFTAVGMVHVEGPGIEIVCATAADVLAVQTFAPTDGLAPTNCRVLNLTELFDIMGSAVTNAMYNTPPPAWLVTIQRFNVKGTGWLILLAILYFIARPPKQKEE
jgi:hypothetical protein